MSYQVVAATVDIVSDLYSLMNEVTSNWKSLAGIMEYSEEKFRSLFTSVGSDLDLIPVLYFNSEIVGFAFCQFMNTFSFTPTIFKRVEVYMPFVKKEHLDHSKDLVEEILKTLQRKGVSTADAVIHRDWGNGVKVAQECGFNLIREMNREAIVNLDYFDKTAFSRNFENMRVIYQADILPAALAVAKIIGEQYKVEFSHETVLPEITASANDAEDTVILKFIDGEVSAMMIYSERNDVASIRRIISRDLFDEENLFSFAMEHFSNRGYKRVHLLFEASSSFKSKLREEGIIFKTLSGFYSINLKDADDLR